MKSKYFFVKGVGGCLRFKSGREGQEEINYN